MAELKTQPNDADVGKFIAEVKDKTKTGRLPQTERSHHTGCLKGER